ncbi:MAG: putative transposase [Desulforhopalus sp.]|jgi:putative transposase
MEVKISPINLNWKNMKRTIIPGLPHHAIQRGLQGRKTFLTNEDYGVYLEIMSDCTRRHGVEIWSYCLMPDHVHFIAIPKETNSLSNCFRAAHSRYTKYINRRTGSSGQFWQARYASHLLDEQYLIACARYIEINPVKRDYVDQPEDWKWSSARAHIMKSDDSLVHAKPLLERVERQWSEFLAETRPENEADLFYLHEKNGRPLGSDAFLAMVEKRQKIRSFL